MIKIIEKEYVENNMAVRTKVTTFLGIPIMKYKETSTSSTAVQSLLPVNKVTKVEGFKQ